MGLSQQRRGEGYFLVAKWAGEGRDWVQEVTMHPPKKDEVIIALLKMSRQPATHLMKQRHRCTKQNPRELDPVAFEDPSKGDGIQLEITGDSKTVVEWINDKAKQGSTGGAVGNVRRQLREFWVPDRRIEKKRGRLGSAHIT